MNKNSISNVLLMSLPLLLCLATPRDCLALGQTQYVETTSNPGSFPVRAAGSVAAICVDTNDFAGVIRAAGDLQTDISRVTARTPVVVHAGEKTGANVILVGTIGKSGIIDQLVREKKIDVSPIAGKWESFFLQVVSQPLPGIENALVICGSDKRGTIYGIYDLSEQIGVSPWYYWADVPVKHHDQLFVHAGKFVQGPPSVKYRGIFLNDEAPDLSNWINEKYGNAPGYSGAANYGRGFYTNLFELMLRIRANYLWPAMWNNAFNEDDTNNPALADEYGIVMGTSHQEPMMRAQKEWDRKYSREYGSWNYARIPNVVSNFWRDGIERNKNYENLTTIGLRGANDTPMAPGGPEANRALLEQIVVDQRKIFADVINPDVTKVPQVWCLYKEVMEYYNAGMRVPDDITLLWAEDNNGNLRRVPTAEERQRAGGAGIYYHMDYVGGPRNYKWINTSPIAKIYDQMSLAKHYGADRVWIVNVGHFKGYELPMQYFMDLGYNSERWTGDNIQEYMRTWAAQQFDPAYAKDIAEIMDTYTKFNGRRKPEQLEPSTFSLVNYNEAENVVVDYQAIVAKAKAINAKLPAAQQAAFYELVLFPAEACANLTEMYVAAGQNALYAKQGRASAADKAAEVHALFNKDGDLMNYYNKTFLDGKWDHFMDQTHIGYTSWQDPPQNSLNAISLAEPRATDTNAVAETVTPTTRRGRGGFGGGAARNTVLPDVPDAAAMGVAVEGSETAVTNGEATLPQFDSFNQQRHYIDVFNKGKTSFGGTVSVSEPWIEYNAIGNLDGRPIQYLPVIGGDNQEHRIWVSINWDKAPKGSANGTIKISGAGREVTVNVKAFNPTEVTRDSLKGFVEGEGFVSIEPEHYTRKTDAGENRWVRIEDYGRTLSGMRATSPSDGSATPMKDSPCLEYQTYLFSTGPAEVVAVTSPIMNIFPGRGIEMAVSLDDGAPQVVTVVPKGYGPQGRDWETSVKDNARYVKATLPVEKAGYHTVKIWMVDPGVVLQKLVVNMGGLKPSYLGPPESFHR